VRTPWAAPGRQQRCHGHQGDPRDAYSEKAGTIAGTWEMYDGVGRNLRAIGEVAPAMPFCFGQR